MVVAQVGVKCWFLFSLPACAMGDPLQLLLLAFSLGIMLTYTKYSCFSSHTAALIGVFNEGVRDSTANPTIVSSGCWMPPEGDGDCGHRGVTFASYP